MKIDNVVKITALAYGGNGIGRLDDGRVCFVPGTLPGETVEICITAEKKRFVSAQMVRLIDKSEHRISPECPLYGKCPGCCYMHGDYETEFFWKEKQLKDFLVRSGVAAAEAVKNGFPAPQREFYRNKLTLHPGENGQAGYYAFDNRSIIPVDFCRLADRRINGLLPVKGDSLLRCTASGGARIIKAGKNIQLRENIPGAGEFLVAGDGFFQVNIPVAAELIRKVGEIVEAGSSPELLELYCGVGVFSIALAEKIPGLRCTGVEVNANAVKFAKINAANHQVSDRCRFFAGDAGNGLRKFHNHREFSILLDPPRTGVEKETLKKIIASGASRIIYISCAADTLTRDLKLLTGSGYKVQSSQLFDMFPCTAHFETLTLLSFHGKRK